MTPVRVAHFTTADVTLRFLLFEQLQAFRRAGYDVVGVSGAGPWASELVAAGITHYPVPGLARSWNPTGDLRALAALVRIFRRERFTIVHTHTPKAGILGRIAARLASVPLVVNTVHGLYGIEPDRPLRRWFYLSLERLAASQSDFEFCQSREDCDLLLGVRITSRDKTLHLGNGIDLDHFDPAAVSDVRRLHLREQLGIPEHTLVVGTVGRLVLEKGYREFLTAAAAVQKQRSDVCTLVIGPEEAGKRDAVPAEDLARARASGIRFLGMRTDMRDLYSIMDIFVLASHREGVPRSAIEAAAMGKTLILTDIRGCREVVRPGVNGVLVPMRDPRALAASIWQLLEDSETRRRFGQESRRIALREFDERRIIDRVLQTYRHLLTARSGANLQAAGAQGSVQR